jgi:hypothetical protein
VTACHVSSRRCCRRHARVAVASQGAHEQGSGVGVWCGTCHSMSRRTPVEAGRGGEAEGARVEGAGQRDDAHHLAVAAVEQRPVVALAVGRRLKVRTGEADVVGAGRDGMGGMARACGARAQVRTVRGCTRNSSPRACGPWSRGPRTPSSPGPAAGSHTERHRHAGTVATRVASGRSPARLRAPGCRARLQAHQPHAPSPLTAPSLSLLPAATRMAPRRTRTPPGTAWAGRRPAASWRRSRRRRRRVRAPRGRRRRG